MPLFKKKAEMPTPEKIEAGKVKSYKDLIAPSVVSFRRSPGYYILGNTYRCVWAIRSYAETVEKDSPEIALLRELGESDGITLHIYTRHMPTVERDEIFHRAQNRTNMQKRSSYKLHEQIEADEQLTTLSRMIRETQRTKETFVYCAVFIELIADSLEHLQSKQIETQSILTHHKILVDKLYLRQLQGFESVKPNGKNAFGTEFERVFPASSVANLFPFSYSGKNDKNGFYIGRDQNGSNIIVDFDRRAEDKTNGHILILGNSGEGKSYLMKLIITNVIMAGKKVYILDPDNEYGELVKNLGGTYLDMMDSKYYINVLEPKTWVDPTQEINEFDDSPEAFKKQNRLSQHIAYLRDFFSVYQDFSSAQLDIIEIMLEETYKRRGITPRTDFTKLTSEDYPILSDLYRVIEEKLESYDEEAALAAKAGHPVMYSLEMLKSVGLGLRGICIGAMSRYFNGYTNIPNSNFIDFCVKDALTTNDNLKNAMFLNIFSYMSHKFLTEGSCDLFVDELHEFVKNRLAITYINSFMKRGRKKESGVCIGSQNVEDLLNPSVITLKILSIFSLCLTMLLLGVVNGATYVVKTDIGQDILKKVSIALRPHTPTIMWLCFALLTIYIFARLIIKKWNANDKISDIDRITNRVKNERDKASKAKEGIFNLRNSILLEDIQTSGKVKDELYNYSKEISHTRIEQELECRNAKRNYNKILKELYLLTLKAYKNPSEQIKQLHDELNKL